MFERRRAHKRLEAVAPLGASTPDGALARVSGVVRMLDMKLLAPTTGRPCVAFAVRVHEPGRHEPGGFDQRKPTDYVELVPFAIPHALGDVRVDSQFAELVLPEQRTARISERHWADFCDQRALSPRSTGVERMLEAGAPVTVLGTVTWRAGRPGAETGFREAATRPCIVGDFDHPLLIFDEEI